MRIHGASCAAPARPAPAAVRARRCSAASRPTPPRPALLPGGAALGALADRARRRHAGDAVRGALGREVERSTSIATCSARCARVRCSRSGPQRVPVITLVARTATRPPRGRRSRALKGPLARGLTRAARQSDASARARAAPFTLPVTPALQPVLRRRRRHAGGHDGPAGARSGARRGARLVQAPALRAVRRRGGRPASGARLPRPAASSSGWASSTGLATGSALPSGT